MTIDEALAALAEAIGTDDAQVRNAARDLRTRIPSLAQELLNAGAALKKKELQGEITRLTGELERKQTELDETVREFDAFKAKTPDVATVEANAAKKFQPRIDALTKEVDTLKTTAKDAARSAMVHRFVNELVDTHKVDRQWAEKVVATQHADRIVAEPDGSWKVLQIGSDNPYDAASQEDALKKLAGDASKTVDPRYITSNVRGGGGSQSGAGGGGSRSETELVNEKRAAVPRVF